MQTYKGTANRYLSVNLSDQSWEIIPVDSQDLAAYLGGKGLALKMFLDSFGEEGLGEVNPLGPENLLIFSMGVMLSTGAPCSGRFEVVTRSPLTGLMVGSSCGGPFGEACKTAGWDGLIIRGAADQWSTLRIDENGAAFEDGQELTGLGTHATQEALNLSVREGAAVIGPAGENEVLYANICSGHRFAGRGGVGAVMGSKNLKAIVARGKSVCYEPVRPKAFAANVKKAKKYILRNAYSDGYRKYGTNANVRAGIKAGYSPVRNFRDRWHPEVERSSGEAMAQRYNSRHSTCRHCTVLCGHKGKYPDGTMRQIPEYETIGMFGSNIENFDPDPIGQWNDEMNELGMDTISAGGTIAWAMEAGEKGLRSTTLAFGKTDNISSILEDIAYKRGEGAELALGSKKLSEQYGGTEFAMHVKGIECAAYDPRSAWGHGLGYAVHNKGGCHLGSYLVSLEQQLGYMPAHTTLGKAEWVIFMEDLFSAVNSLQVCLFSVFGILTEPPIPKYLPTFILKIATITMPKVAMALMDWSILSRYFWDVTGIRMNKWGLLKAGERITVLERHMNVLLGMDPQSDTLPARFTTEKDTPYPGKNTVVPIEKMVQRYKKLRHYTSEGGPSPSALRRLIPTKSALKTIKPKALWGKKMYVRMLLSVLSLAIPLASRLSKNVAKAVEDFDEGFTFRLMVHPSGPSISFQKKKSVLRQYKGERCDLIVALKNMEAAWRLLSFQESTCHSEAAGRLSVEGELPSCCAFIRLMNAVEIFLLPRFIARRAVKRWERSNQKKDFAA